MSESDSHPRLKATMRFGNDPDNARDVEQEVLEAMRSLGYPEAASFAVRLAIEEAVSNAIRHGHCNLPDAEIEVRWEIDPRQVMIRVADQGPGFDPGTVPDCRHEERLELPSGRGVMLMNAYMTRVEYNERGNVVTMFYDRSAES